MRTVVNDSKKYNIDREKEFYDNFWQNTKVRKIGGELKIPGIKTLKGKKVLICSCGTGVEAVQAANAGAETFAFDISETAIQKAKTVADFNNVTVTFDKMDFHNLLYDNNCFDIIYGGAILHHVDCSIVGKEIYRSLKTGGVAYFRENSDRNPVLRILRRLLFGKPGESQKQKFLFIKRTGSTDEYPLTEKDVEDLSSIFNGYLIRLNKEFYFFQLINFLTLRNKKLGFLLKRLDRFCGNIIPGIKKYSFTQEILMIKSV